MVRSTAVAAIALLVLLAVPLRAAEPSPVARDLLRATLNYDELTTAEGRSRLASAVRNYCAEVARDYPKNSPSENQWLAGEISGGGDRVMRALASPEMGRRMAARFTEDCAAWSDGLLREPDSVRNYVGLAHAFVRFMGDAEYYAPKNGLDPEQYAFDTALRATVESLLVAALQASKE